MSQAPTRFKTSELFGGEPAPSEQRRFKTSELFGGEPDRQAPARIKTADLFGSTATEPVNPLASPVRPQPDSHSPINSQQRFREAAAEFPELEGRALGDLSDSERRRYRLDPARAALAGTSTPAPTQPVQRPPVVVNPTPAQRMAREAQRRSQLVANPPQSQKEEAQKAEPSVGDFENQAVSGRMNELAQFMLQREQRMGETPLNPRIPRDRIGPHDPAGVRLYLNEIRTLNPEMGRMIDAELERARSEGKQQDEGARFVQGVTDTALAEADAQGLGPTETENLVNERLKSFGMKGNYKADKPVTMGERVGGFFHSGPIGVAFPRATGEFRKAAVRETPALVNETIGGVATGVEALTGSETAMGVRLMTSQRAEDIRQGVNVPFSGLEEPSREERQRAQDEGAWWKASDRASVPYSAEWWASSIGEQVPIMASLFVGGGLAAGSAKLAGAAARGQKIAGYLGGTGTVGAFEASNSANAIYRRLVEAGVDPTEASQRSAVAGSVVGLVNAGLEALPFGRFVMRNKAVANRLVNAASGAAIEGGTEAAQEFVAVLGEIAAETGQQLDMEAVNRIAQSAAVGSVIGTGAGAATPTRQQETPDGTQGQADVREAADTTGGADQGRRVGDGRRIDTVPGEQGREGQAPTTAASEAVLTPSQAQAAEPEGSPAPADAPIVGDEQAQERDNQDRTDDSPADVERAIASDLEAYQRQTGQPVRRAAEGDVADGGVRELFSPLGLRVEYIESADGSELTRPGMASNVPGSRVVYVDASQANSPRVKASIALHEWTHDLQTNNPQEWERLAQDVERNAPTWLREKVRRYAEAEPGVRFDAREEGVASLAEDLAHFVMNADAREVAQLAERAPSVLQRVWDALVKFARKVGLAGKVDIGIGRANESGAMEYNAVFERAGKMTAAEKQRVDREKWRAVRSLQQALRGEIIRERARTATEGTVDETGVEVPQGEPTRTEGVEGGASVSPEGEGRSAVNVSTMESRSLDVGGEGSQQSDPVANRKSTQPTPPRRVAPETLKPETQETQSQMGSQLPPSPTPSSGRRQTNKRTPQSPRPSGPQPYPTQPQDQSGADRPQPTTRQSQQSGKTSRPSPTPSPPPKEGVSPRSGAQPRAERTPDAATAEPPAVTTQPLPSDIVPSQTEGAIDDTGGHEGVASFSRRRDTGGMAESDGAGRSPQQPQPPERPSGDSQLPEKLPSGEASVDRASSFVRRFFDRKGWATRSYIAQSGSTYITIEHPDGFENVIRIADHRNTTSDPEMTARVRTPDFNISINPETEQISGWRELAEVEWEDAPSSEWTDGGINPDDLLDRHRKAYENALKREQSFNRSSPDEGGQFARRRADTAGADPNNPSEVEQARKAWVEQGTDSPWFRKWFGDSKVVDENGDPLVVYHGTPDRFTVFNTTREGAHFGTREQATSVRGKGNLNVETYYLSIQNPLRMPDIGGWNTFNNMHQHLSVGDHITPQQADAAWEAWQRSDDAGWKSIKDALRTNGYDGIVYENEQEGDGDSYIAFSPTQIKSATGNRGTFSETDPDIRFARRRAGDPNAKGKLPTVKQLIANLTGLKLSQPKTISEKEALRASLRAQRRAAQAAYKAGVQAVREQIPSIRKEVRDAIRAKQDKVKETQKQVRQLIEKMLPIERRGRFLKEVQSATTMATLRNALLKLQKETVRAEAEPHIRSIKRLMSRKRLSKLTNEQRQKVREVYGKAAGSFVLMARRMPKGVDNPTFKDMFLALSEIESTDNAIREIYAQRKAEVQKFGETRKMNRREWVNALFSNVVTTRKPVREDPSEIERDVEVGRGRRYLRGLSDLRSITSSIEKSGIHPSVLDELLVERMTGAEENYLSDKRAAYSALQQIVGQYGLRSIDKALGRWTEVLGTGKTEYVEVNFEDGKRKVPIGTAAALVATDPTTRPLLDAGTPIQFKTGREQNPLQISNAEIERLRDVLPEGAVEIVQAMKLIMKPIADRAFSAHYRLKGWEPERVEDYWPRQRNVAYTKRLPESLKEASKYVEHYAENAGFTKERNKDRTTPILIDDIFSTFNRHIDGLLKLAHLAEPVRDAAMVLTHPRITTVINRRHGTSMNRTLRRYVYSGGRMDANDPTKSARVVSRLNGNIAVSNLAFNPGTWAVQLGGAIRLAPILGRYYAVGIKNAPKVKMRDIVENSGYFWERYRSNPSARFSGVNTDSASMFEDSRALDAADAMVADLLKGDFKGAERAWRSLGEASMSTLNLFDAVNAKIAWAAKTAQAKKEHPDWTPDQVTEWVAKESSVVIRETQNSTSPIDLAAFPLEHRNDALSMFSLFTSDPLKARNRVIRAWGKGAAFGAATTAAEMANIVWAITARHGYKFAIGYAMWAALGGDEDDWQKMQNDALDLDRKALDIAQDVLGTFDPLIVGNIMPMVRYRGDLAESPVQSTVNEAGRGVSDLASAAWSMTERDTETAKKKAIEGVNRIATNLTALLLGNPIHAMWNRTTKEAMRQSGEPTTITFDLDTESAKEEYNRLKRMETNNVLEDDERDRLLDLKAWRSGIDDASDDIREAMGEDDRESDRRARDRAEAITDYFNEPTEDKLTSLQSEYGFNPEYERLRVRVNDARYQLQQAQDSQDKEREAEVKDRYADMLKYRRLVSRTEADIRKLRDAIERVKNPDRVEAMRQRIRDLRAQAVEAAKPQRVATATP